MIAPCFLAYGPLAPISEGGTPSDARVIEIGVVMEAVKS